MSVLDDGEILALAARDFETQAGAGMAPLQAVFAAGQVFALEQAILALDENPEADVDERGELATASWLLERATAIRNGEQ